MHLANPLKIRGIHSELQSILDCRLTMKLPMTKHRTAATLLTRQAFALTLLAAAPARAQTASTQAADDRSLEELRKADIQTASRRSQRLQGIAAAALVITRGTLAVVGTGTDERLPFEVKHAALEQAQPEASASLLKLARTINGAARAP